MKLLSFNFNIIYVITCITIVAFATDIKDEDLGFELLMSGIGGGEIIREEIKVEGNIPIWLDGTLIQNGGGRFE